MAKPPPHTGTKIEGIRKLYATGITMTATGKLAGVTRHTVARALWDS